MQRHYQRTMRVPLLFQFDTSCMQTLSRTAHDKGYGVDPRMSLQKMLNQRFEIGTFCLSGEGGPTSRLSDAPRVVVHHIEIIVLQTFDDGLNSPAPAKLDSNSTSSMLYSRVVHTPTKS